MLLVDFLKWLVDRSPVLIVQWSFFFQNEAELSMNSVNSKDLKNH